MAVPIAVAIILPGCSGDESARYTGLWQYDRQSLRALAHASAIESVTADGQDPISSEERAELERWVDAQHDKWNKTLELLPSGRYVARSQIGEGRPEEITGTWSVLDGAVRLIQDDGEVMATGRMEPGRLVLQVTDGEGVTAEMVMLASNEQGQ